MARLTLEQVRKLISNKIIRIGETQVIVDLVSSDDYDSYIITNINNPKNRDYVEFEIEHPRTTLRLNVNYRQIRTIDGMNIKNFLACYNVNQSPIIDIDIPTDVLNEVIEKENVIIDGYTLTDGMKIIFREDVTPKYNNKIFRVKIIDNKITLASNRGRPKNQ